MNWDTGEYLSLGTQALGHLFTALGARGQAKTAKLNAQLQYQADKFNSERQYQIDLFTGRRAHQLGQYEAESLSMQGRIKQAQLRHQEAMSEMEAQRERMNLQHQADMARINANFARLGKTAARAAGDHASARYSLQAGNTKASMRAGLAANGVVLDEGSTQELMDTADLTRGIDMQTIENNAIFEAFGYENKAQDLMGQAAIAEANKASVMGQYYGADAVRTDYKNYTLDGSRYASRTPVFDHSQFIKPNLYFANSLMGSASDFAANWYASYKRNNPQPGGQTGSPFAMESLPSNDYYRSMGYRNPSNTSKLRWR